MWKWKSLSPVWLFATPRTIHSIEFFRPEYWSGQPFPSPGDLPNPGIQPRSPTLQADSLPAEPHGKPKNTGVGSLSLLQGIFLTPESNQGLLHCRWILYQLSYQGSKLIINNHSNLLVYVSSYYLSIKINISIIFVYPYIHINSGGSVLKNLPATTGGARDVGLIPGSGKSFEVGNGKCHWEIPWTE